MKTKIEHILKDRPVSENTEILLIGTFNPKTEKNTADFFYGRGRNYLWHLLPQAFGDESLKYKPVEEKKKYIKAKKIDFIDLISSVEVEEPDNYDDDYIDKNVNEWRDILSILPRLKNLQRVGFTRKGLSDIRNMKVRIKEIQSYCENNGLHFKLIYTPSRFWNEKKQSIWTNFLNPNKK